MVWAGIDSTNGSDIFYQTAAAPTFGFSNPRDISDNPGISKAPRIGVDSADQAHVVWGDNTIDPDFDVLYAKAFPGGGSAGPVVVAATTGQSVLPDIEVDITDQLRVCWQDDSGGAPGANFEVLCSDLAESIPPVTAGTTNPVGDPTCGGFIHTQPVTVTLSSTDNSGSVASLTYRVDGQAPVTVSYGTCPTVPPFITSFPVAGEGSHVVRFFAIDCDGNAEAEKTLRFKVDSTPPSTTAITSGSCGIGCPLYTGPVDVTLAGVDPGPGGSGIKQTTFSLDGGASITYTGPFTVSDDGVHTVEFFSEDKACNVESPKTVSFEIRRALTVEITRPKKGTVY
ncbi:MAG: OmpL47-type beta-barrel domain-containing protein, partial [Candidatus Binatia bacterium]